VPRRSRIETRKSEALNAGSGRSTTRAVLVCGASATPAHTIQMPHLESLTDRDAHAGDLLSAFDFSQTP
jgi:hypothetical protein